MFWWPKHVNKLSLLSTPSIIFQSISSRWEQEGNTLVKVEYRSWSRYLKFLCEYLINLICYYKWKRFGSRIIVLLLLTHLSLSEECVITSSKLSSRLLRDYIKTGFDLSLIFVWIVQLCLSYCDFGLHIYRKTKITNTDYCKCQNLFYYIMLIFIAMN